jgi:hypothetical protein
MYIFHASPFVATSHHRDITGHRAEMGALFAVFWCMRRKLGGAESPLGGALADSSGAGRGAPRGETTDQENLGFI